MKITAFTSDTHYGHKNVIRYCNRPFASVEEMTRGLIDRYNAVIGPEDTVFWVGDCFFCSMSKAREILSALNGVKLLVRGNHDKSAATMAAIGFSLVMDQCVLDFSGQAVRVCHYPYGDTRYPDRAPMNLKHEKLIHGHTHSVKRVNGKMIHVGVDAWDYRPAVWDEVAEIVGRISNKRSG